MTPKIFISHSSIDKASADLICSFLERNNVACWIAPRDVTPGKDYGRCIVEAIEITAGMILIVSSSSASSAQVVKEVECAFTHSRLIIPICIDLAPLSKSLEYYIGNTHRLDASTGLQEKLPRVLETIQEYLVTVYEKNINPQNMIPLNPPANSAPIPSLLPQQTLGIASVKDVLDWGWTVEKLLDELIIIDYSTMDGLDEKSEGTTQQWTPVFMEHPETWRLLTAGPKNIVGYWCFVPLFDIEFQIAKAGKLHENSITLDNIPFFEMPGAYKMYFVSIVLLPPYRSTGFLPLLDALCEQLIALAESGIYFDEVCTNAFTTEGKRLCKTLNMIQTCNHADKGMVYTLPFNPLPDLPIFKRHPDLQRHYANRPY